MTTSTPTAPSTNIRTAITYISWPLILAICIGLTHIAFQSGWPLLGFNLIYFALIVCLFVLERVMPHEKKWQESDGQLFADLAHTLMNKGVVQALIGFAAVLGFTKLLTPMAEPGHGIWPRDWPLAAQVLMGVIVAEFGLYWSHRLSHEFHPFWRFHAVHHSVTKLWIVNTGRFHYVNSLLSIIAGTGMLVLFGAPMEVILWLSAITAYIGLLTHCNIEMNFAFPMSHIFNTPELHRWHHSKKLREGNKNYGENLVIWDIIFRSHFIDPSRRPPVNIGITSVMPERFIDQLTWPYKDLSLRFKPYPKKSETPPSSS